MKKLNLKSRSLRIDGKQIFLRPLLLKEADEFFHLIQVSRRELGRWLPWVKGTTKTAHTKKFLKEGLKNQRRGEVLALGIFLKSSSKIIGCVGARHLQTGVPEIGYWMGTPFTGNGYSCEASTIFADALFNNLPIHKIEIRCEPRNFKSRAIPERLGFQEEGHLRHTTCAYCGVYKDLIVYGVLKPEWKSLRKRLLSKYSHPR